jgi:hypothetical protein
MKLGAAVGRGARPRGAGPLGHRGEEQQRPQHAGQADDHEGHLPRLELADDGEGLGSDAGQPDDQPAADKQRHAAAGDLADADDRDCLGQLAALEHVAGHRIGAGRVAAFADADQHARGKQFPEIAREAAGDRHHAPEGYGRGDDPLARPAVDETRHRDAGEHVEQHEGEPDEQADLRVA